MAKEIEQPQLGTPKFRLNGLYVKDISFENPLAPDIFINPISKTEMNVGVDVNIVFLKDTAYEVSLRVMAKADAEGGKPFFLVEVVYAGLFAINPALAVEEHNKILFTEAASVIFPFARRIVADLVQEGGFPPLLLDPINFESLYISKQSQLA